MRLGATSSQTDRAIEALVEALAEEVHNFDDAPPAYREYVLEEARLRVEDAVTDFDPDPLEVYAADRDLAEGAEALMGER